MTFENHDGRKPQRNIDDILSLATRELKRQCDTSEGARPSVTRTRVMMSLRQQERRRTAAIYVLLPAAAVLVASTAWAAASGHLPEVVKSLGTKLGLVDTPAAPVESAAAPVKAKGKAKDVSGSGEGVNASAETAPASAPAVVAAPSASAPEAGPAQEPAVAPPVVPVASAPVVAAHAPAASVHAKAAAPQSVVGPGNAVKPVPSAEEPGDKLFEAAHRAHFGARDWPAALAAWDRYLAASPSGRFVPEARYNRAIALLRLGRTDEGIRELTPFADGQYGTYRQQEARELIEALEK